MRGPVPRLIVALRSRAASALRGLASALRGAVAARRAREQAPPHRRSVQWKRRLRRWAWRIVMAASTLLGLGLLGFAALLWHYGQDLPRTSELKGHRPPEVTRILARDGTPLAELFVERRTVVPISVVPRSMTLAVLAAEDASFYQHEGLNYFGILRALLVNLRSAQARQGGSTITQQVVKNVLLTPERTFARKIRELILARRIEQELTKDEILELYLNQIYFGHGRYGVEEAARYYFGKSVKDVQLAEAALLAGLVKGPSLYSPRVDLARAGERRSYVLQQLGDKGFASRADVDAAARQPIVLAPPPETAAELAPEVVTEVERVLVAAAGPHASRGGYTVTTTIDPKLQAAARAAVRGNLDAYAARRGLVAPLKRGKGDPAPFQGTPAQGSERVYNGVVTKADDAAGTLTVRVGTAEGVVKLERAARYNPRKLPPSQFAEIGKVVRVTFAGGDPRGGRLELALGPQGALVALDVRTAEVLAVVGGYDAVRGALNRARSARRQPASTFKPIVYSYGIHTRAFTAASILETQPAALRGKYRPDNYDESDGQAPRRLREALASSVNVAAVWTLEQLGPAKVVAWARSLGITSKLGADLSLALGAYEVTPFEMVAAFNTFAAGGTYREPVLVRSIVGPGGQPVPLPGAAPARQVMGEAEAYIVTSLLRSVVESGTAKRALSMSTPVAGKTGTSNAAKDAWFVGYSTDIACAVWTGHDDASPLGPGETGGATSLPAFIAFMQEAHRARPRTDFAAPPDGLVRVPIDPATGQLALPGAAGAIEEVFLAGTEPTTYAELPSGGEAPGFVWPF
ncbi:penicillin-binding protein [Sorangium cellulosum]|uniref:peptidoglycan glycosyltransferase n=1 Tax=Sorangium cellulosum TaxID=56 RepID=A0A150PTZ6_SORCE|nr:penicillin-binding protein [Sorangium cellulosum]